MYEAEGFAFETKEEAETARTEAEAIRYIKQQTKMDDPETILRLYNSLLEKNLFQTEIGLHFLLELQDYLKTIPFVKSEEIRPIPARVRPADKKAAKGTKNKPAGDRAKEQKPRRQKAKMQEETKKGTGLQKAKDTYRTPFHIALFAAIVLAVCVVGMFVITYISGNSANIVNYENEILNRYSAWEEDLDSREKALNERELQIEEKEAELGITSEEEDTE